VVQQLRYSPKEYGGYCLTEPKAGSSGTVDLDPLVSERLSHHVRIFPPIEIEMLDRTGPAPVRRRVPLLFTTVHGNPFTDRTWSGEWIKWRRKAGWPEDPKQNGFHPLRHYFATTLIREPCRSEGGTAGVTPRNASDHLEIYVHFWPRQDRPRGVAGAALREAVKALGMG
jgi:integrase